MDQFYPALVTVFMLVATRGVAGAKQLLGILKESDFVHGIVGSDRWSGSNWLDPRQRQLCWAHLKRDFQALVDRGGEPARIGQALLDQVELMFGLWHRIRDDTLSQLDFQAATQPIQVRVGEILRETSARHHNPSAQGATRNEPHLSLLMVRCWRRDYAYLLRLAVTGYRRLC